MTRVGHTGAGAPAAGIDLLMLPGWGVDAGILTAGLSDSGGSARPRGIDLPVAEDDFDRAVGEMARCCDRPAIWLGWSLGGMLALQAALRFPDRVAALILIATTPRFVNDAHWSWGVEAAQLLAMQRRYRSQADATLDSFFHLQALHGPHRRRVVQTLRQHRVMNQSTGLQWLQAIDLRAGIDAIRCPVCLLLGANDPLIHPDAGPWWRARLPQLELHIVDAASHAPFLTHPATVQTVIDRFVHAHV